MQKVPDEILAFLRRTDTPTVSNAIETFQVRMRNEGYIFGVNHCMFPKLEPIAGYAVTGRIRTSTPPISNLCYYHRVDWWEHVASLPSPKVIVLDDSDPQPGFGAFVGEIHAHIAKALGCVAYVTNGTVRDLSGLEAARFQCFASGATVSHSYAHITEFGEQIEIGGVRISEGELLHGDCHGVQTIPFEVCDHLPEAVARVLERERRLIELCNSPGFTIEKFAAALKLDEPPC